MITAAAVAACVVLALLAVFQVLLIAGARLGRFAWGGQHDVLPRRLRVGSAVSIILYGVFALIILDSAGIISLVPDSVSTPGIWILTGYFLLGVVLNGISRSRYERYTMTPVALVLALLCLGIALY
ncbi:hypothetical protein [Arthrobacter sp. Br18]|uniref:hypothetical protein n=1 Tax=Arthrobacter sp. Br18 TaxID=1312954 RepID=UPI00047C9512|nr:hypothetical protein [Arthrobacter sp. Br18]